MYSESRGKYLRDHPEISPAILAHHLGVSESFVKQFQRKLGIRPFTGNKPRKK